MDTLYCVDGNKTRFETRCSYKDDSCLMVKMDLDLRATVWELVLMHRESVNEYLCSIQQRAKSMEVRGSVISFCLHPFPSLELRYRVCNV